MVAEPLTGPAAVSPAALRSALSHFAAGVTVVTTRWQGVAHAMTATAFCSVSLDPPLVLVCVGHASRFHAAVTAAGVWAVSMLAAGQEPLARRFSRRGRDLLTQFDGVGTEPAPVSGAPILTGVLTWLDCRTVDQHVAGDHTIVVGEVLRVGDEEPLGAPLAYYRGNYHRLTDM